MTDATDAELIARLRGGGIKRLGYMGVELHDTAADRIEALAARVAVLEAALQGFVKVGADPKSGAWTGAKWIDTGALKSAWDAALRALAKP